MGKTLVIGYGVSGKAAANFLIAQGKEVAIVDRKGPVFDTPDLDLHGIDQAILSPGIPLTHPLVQKVRASGIEILGELELGLRYVKNRSFAITGSNGKTTTVLLTTHILNAAGLPAHALGNVGEPVTHYLLNRNPDEILIFELSSFQLQTLALPIFEAACILNITPNHLDWHATFEDYAEAKGRIQKCLTPNGVFYVSEQAFEVLKPESALVMEKEVALIKNLGYMEWTMASRQSIQASYLLCRRCGVTDVAFLEGLKTFRKPAHRIEWVAEKNQVVYYNDSKSSNIHSVMHAVEQLNEPIVLIAGGVHKGSSYRPWVDCFLGKVKHIVAYGKAAPILECELSPFFPLTIADRFQDAVKEATRLARAGEIVLLSPGCSSYDQFQNYEQRGDEFKRLVREMP